MTSTVPTRARASRSRSATSEAGITRRLCTVAGSYRYAVGEDLLDHSRRPCLDYESHATGLDRNELGALLVAAGLGPPTDHALVSLLALNGLRPRVSVRSTWQAPGADNAARLGAAIMGRYATAPASCGLAAVAVG